MNSHRPILKALNDAGYQAYFVGGCVRDHLLGRECKDIDICTSATPDEVAELFPESKLVGAHFGVTIVKMGELEAEVATFRTDGCYSDNRRPDSVVFTRSLNDDLKRRDFTMNALVMDVSGKYYGRIPGHDCSRDIGLRLVKCIGSPVERFTEDALRMLRAIRFSAQLGFIIEPHTFQSIIDCAPLINKVSSERVQIELSKILTSGRAGQGIWDLYRTRLSEHFMPHLRLMLKTEQNPKYHPEGNVLTHTLKLLEQLPTGCSLTLALAALLHDVGKPATRGTKDGQPTFHGHEEQSALIAEHILRRLKFSNEVVDTVVSLVSQHMVFRNLSEMRKAKRYRFLRQENFGELLELHRMDAMAGSGNMANYDYATRELMSVPEEVLRPVRLVTGQDLIEFGLKPGPKFAEWLTAVENMQLEGIVENKEQAVIALYDLTRDEREEVTK